MNRAPSSRPAPKGFSPKLSAVLDAMIRDRTTMQDVAAKLQRDDPSLFAELQEWIRRGQGEVALSRRQAALMAYTQGDYRNARHLLEQVLAAGYGDPDAQALLVALSAALNDKANLPAVEELPPRREARPDALE